MSVASFPEDVLAGGRRRTRRRRAVNRLMKGLATASALLAVGVLGLMVASVLERGAGALSVDFFTKVQVPFGQTGGGVAHAIVGTVLLVALATAFALPAGVLVAIYMSEFASPRIAGGVRLVLDVLNGVPTVVTGIFIFGLLVVGHGQSGVAGSVALAVIMLPLIARATQEVLALVPASLREASLALGVSRWRTVLGVVLPASFSGIMTGTTLAIARAAGETAPLLFTSSIAADKISTDVTHALASLTVTIFTYSESPDPADHQKAWAAALLLIFFVFCSSFGGRLLLARSRRWLEGRPPRWKRSY